MGLTEKDLTHSRLSSSTTPPALEFLGVESANGGSVITCLWKNDAGADMIMRATQQEWDTLREQMSRGVGRGFPWNTWSTLMMFGEIDPQKGRRELYGYLEDGELVSLAPENG